MCAARFRLPASAGLAALENNVLRVAKSGTKWDNQMHIRDSDEMVFIAAREEGSPPPGRPGCREANGRTGKGHRPPERELRRAMWVNAERLTPRNGRSVDPSV
jgi:hypothetical protein